MNSRLLLTYIGSIFSKLRFSRQNLNERLLSGAAVFVLSVLSLGAVHKNDALSEAERTRRDGAALQALLHEVESALRDQDPVTTALLQEQIFSLANGHDPAKNRALRQFLKGERAEAIEQLAIYADAQTSTLAQEAAVTLWHQTAALSFLDAPETSLKAYEEITDLTAADPAAYFQRALLNQRSNQNSDARSAYALVTDMPAVKNSALAAASLGNLGVIALRDNNIQLAEYYFLKSLQLNQKLGRQKATALQHTNLGLAHIAAGNQESAKTNLQKALFLFDELDEIQNVGMTFTTLGANALRMRDLETATYYFERSYNAYAMIGAREKMADQLQTLGQINHQQRLLSDARSQYSQALELNLSLERKPQSAELYAGLGVISLETQDQAQACNYWTKADALYSSLEKSDMGSQVSAWLIQLNCA